MLTLRNVSKTYGKRTILDQVDADFLPGVSLLIGPSGAGKSTLLRLAATAETPTSGNLSWQGKSVKRNRSSLRRDLGYAPQLVDLPGDLTGMEFMRHMAAVKGLGRGSKEQARGLLERLGLGSSVDISISAWSGGMRRRLVFAQAMLGSPKLLALDEPTAELDSETAGIVTSIIQSAAQEATVLVTTHLTDQFAALSASVFNVRDGKVAI